MKPAMKLSVPLPDARAACLASVEELVAAAEGFDELALLGASRCHGWSRMDVVVHLAAGWQEMLAGLATPVDAAPTVDAATYWPAFAAAYGGGDPVAELVRQRRRSAAHDRPAAAVAEMAQVGRVLARAVTALEDRPRAWQEWVFTAGDFLAIWAVEHAVHHLDLLTDRPVPADALGFTRATVEALAGRLPAIWSDERAALVGAGRTPVPADAGAVADRLPVLG